MNVTIDSSAHDDSHDSPDEPLLVARPPVWTRLLVTGLPLAGLVTAVAFLMHGHATVFLIVLALSVALGSVAPGLLIHQIRVFPDRLEQRGLLGRQRLRFDEVVRVRLGRGKSLGTMPTMGVKFYGSNTKIGLGLVKDSANVYEFINPLVVPLLADRLNRQIDEAGSLPFGNLTAQSDGVVTRKGLLPWHIIGSFSFGPAGARILPTNHPALTVTVPNNTDNIPALMWIVEWRKANFFENLKGMAAQRGISEAELLAAYERRLPAGEKFGMPEHDAEFGRHLCTLPPAKFLGITFGRGKYALYEGGVVAGRKRIAVQDCESVAYKVINQYYEGTYIGTHRTLTLRGKSGAKVSFSSMREEGETFCDAALGRVLPPLVDEHRERLRKGEVIKYGKAKLSQLSLEFGRKSYLLADLKAVNDHQGSLYFWIDPNAKPVGSIDLTTPNAMVLHRLVHEMIYGAG
jgi:hypothetical protein